MERWLAFFSDVPANILYRWAPGSRRAEVFLEPSGGILSNPDFVEAGSNGLTLDRDGRLLLCQSGGRRVARLEEDGRTQTVLADRFEGRRFNNPNDLVSHSSGAVYFTDPSYGFRGHEASPLREMPWNGVYRIAPDLTVDLLTRDLPFPNGVAFSPDEQTLYVAVSDAKLPRISAFDVQGDGLLGESRLFFDAVPLRRKGLQGTCDGLKVDIHGNVFATAPGGVAVLSPDGKHLGTILLGQYGTHPHVREALKDAQRERITILTKTRATTAEQARADLDRFRRELKTNYLDVLLLHCLTDSRWPETMRPVMDVIDEAQEKGAVRTKGVSCH